jgi:hypothetical protein
MTAKEKAKEIVSRFEETLFGYDVFDDDWVKCINCAAIAVDEIINEYFEIGYRTEGSNLRLPYEWWEEVKTEIYNLNQ